MSNIKIRIARIENFLNSADTEKRRKIIICAFIIVAILLFGSLYIQKLFLKDIIDKPSVLQNNEHDISLEEAEQAEFSVLDSILN